MPSSGRHKDGAERIALYLCVSSEEQRDRETIEIQREFLENYCGLYGFEVAEAYEDDATSGRHYHYYACRKKRVTSAKRTRGLRCPKVRADWLEELVWSDVREFIQNPGEALQRVREQLGEGEGARGPGGASRGV